MNPPLPSAPEALVLVVGVHQADPAPALPATATPLVQATLAAGNPIKIIAVDGTPEAVPTPATTSVSRNTCTGFTTTLAHATNAVSAAVSTAKANSNGDSLYSALVLAGNAADAAGWHAATIVVVDSGLSDTGPLDFSKPGMTSADPVQAAAFATSSQPLKLSGFTVIFHGLGQTAPPQQPLSPAQQKDVQQIWDQVAIHAKAKSVQVVTDVRPRTGPRTPYVVKLTPVAPIPVFTPPTRARPNFTTLTSTDVHFETDSAALQDPDRVAHLLAPIAAWLAADRTHHVTLYGRTDSAGTVAHNKALSVRRANTLKDLLLRRTIDSGEIAPSQISTIGQGENFPGHRDDTGPGGTLNPAAAAWNRQVLVKADIR